jgi:putative glutamine amidotransferase
MAITSWYGAYRLRHEHDLEHGTNDDEGKRVNRPRILIPARFSESASALRFRAEITARKLVAAVYAAGGEPLTVHPHAPAGAVSGDEIAERFDFIDGVLLPGGGDLTPALYGGESHDEHYDMDPEQDAFDLEVARWALRSGRPVLAICRGLQVANVALGGTLIAHMDTPHRHVTSELALEPGCRLSLALGAEQIIISCYHHQALDGWAAACAGRRGRLTGRWRRLR